MAFCLSGMVVLYTNTRRPRHFCSLYKYSFCSLWNLLSLWCQYEALQYRIFSPSNEQAHLHTNNLILSTSESYKTYSSYDNERKSNFINQVWVLRLRYCSSVVLCFCFCFDTTNDQSRMYIAMLSFELKLLSRVFQISR